MKILSGEFWEAATERALKTAGQFGAAALGAVVWTDVTDLAPAGQVIGLALLFGMVSSYLTSLASAGVGNAGPSLANESVPATPTDDDDDDDEPASALPAGGYTLAPDDDPEA